MQRRDNICVLCRSKVIRNGAKLQCEHDTYVLHARCEHLIEEEHITLCPWCNHNELSTVAAPETPDHGTQMSQQIVRFAQQNCQSNGLLESSGIDELLESFAMAGVYTSENDDVYNESTSR